MLSQALSWPHSGCLETPRLRALCPGLPACPGSHSMCYSLALRRLPQKGSVSTHTQPPPCSECLQEGEIWGHPMPTLALLAIGSPALFPTCVYQPPTPLTETSRTVGACLPHPPGVFPSELGTVQEAQGGLTVPALRPATWQEAWLAHHCSPDPCWPGPRHQPNPPSAQGKVEDPADAQGRGQGHSQGQLARASLGPTDHTQAAPSSEGAEGSRWVGSRLTAGPGDRLFLLP